MATVRALAPRRANGIMTAQVAIGLAPIGAVVATSNWSKLAALTSLGAPRSADFGTGVRRSERVTAVPSAPV